MTADTNKHKFVNLVLHICRMSEGDETFGATKLNKLLFFADFYHYKVHGHSITGAEYQKLPQGPAPRNMVPTLQEMVGQGLITIVERDYYGHKQKKPFALKEPDLSQFNGNEIAIVDFIVCDFRHASASKISDMSHGFVGWQLACDGETIPYESILLDDRELTEKEKERAAVMASQVDIKELEALLA